MASAARLADKAASSAVVSARGVPRSGGPPVFCFLVQRRVAARIPQDIAFDIIDPRAYADGKRVDDAFMWLRQNAPLEQAQPTGYDPFWVVTRHADILEVERQNELFPHSS